MTSLVKYQLGLDDQAPGHEHTALFRFSLAKEARDMLLDWRVEVNVRSKAPPPPPPEAGIQTDFSFSIFSNFLLAVSWRLLSFVTAGQHDCLCVQDFLSADIRTLRH